MQLSKASVLHCQACGGAFKLLEIASHVSCPYCKKRQELPVALQEQLGRYEGAVGAKLARAELARETTRAARRERYQLALFPMLYLTPVVLMFASTPWMRPGLVVPFGVALVALYHLRASRPFEPPAGAIVPVSCPNCGGSGELTVGALVSACRFCQASLVPTATVTRRAVDAAWLAARHARLEQYRAERDNDTVGDWGGRVVVVTVFGFMAAGPLALGWQVIDLALERGWVLRSVVDTVQYAVLALAVTLALLVLRSRHRKRKVFQAPLHDLTRQFGGKLIQNRKEARAWLNRFWPAPYHPDPFFVAAAVVARGYPILIDLDGREQGRGKRPRLNAVVGAVTPPFEERVIRKEDPEAVRCEARLMELGFTVEADEAGLLARGSDERTASVQRDPDAVHALAPVLMALADYADALGATPPEQSSARP